MNRGTFFFFSKKIVSVGRMETKHFMRMAISVYKFKVRVESERTFHSARWSLSAKHTFLLAIIREACFTWMLSFLIVVISRKCYKCSSTRSWAVCDAKRTKVLCRSSQRCVKIKASAYGKYGAKVDAYVKGCAATCVASRIRICNHPNVKCAVHCCSSDYCNGSSGPVVSGLLLIFSISFVYFFGF